MQQIISVEIILYVSDQEKSVQFYEKLFRVSPDLHVPGMTEFRLSENCKLGLMELQKYYPIKHHIQLQEMEFLDANFILMLMMLNMNFSMP